MRRRLLTPALNVSCPQSVQLSLSEVGPENFISNKFQGDAKAAGMESTL